MTLFPTDAPIFSVILDGGDMRGSEPYVLDVVAQRWTSSVPLDDAVLAYIASLWVHYGRFWNDHGQSMRHFLSGFSHPDFSFAPNGGAVHKGKPVGVCVRIYADDDAGTLVLPDGRVVPSDGFAPTRHTEWDAQRTGEMLTKHFDGESGAALKAMAEVVLGVAQALDGVTTAPTGATLHEPRSPNLLAEVVCGRAARVLAAVPAAGKSAIEQGENNGKAIMRALLETWYLRPDRGWSPTSWRVAPAAKLSTANACPHLVAAGAAAARFALARPLPFSAYRVQDTEQDSAHARLATKTYIKAMDTAFLAALKGHTDPLTPTAARAAAKT